VLDGASLIPLIGVLKFGDEAVALIKQGDKITAVANASKSGSNALDAVSKGKKNIFNSIKNAPKYPEGFIAAQNGTKKIPMDNKKLLDELRQIESGDWKKVYKDGYDKYGNKISIHYFESPSGKVFDVDVKQGWSN
jgi:hypothetical protein